MRIKRVLKPSTPNATPTTQLEKLYACHSNAFGKAERPLEKWRKERDQDTYFGIDTERIGILEKKTLFSVHPGPLMLLAPR
eukprot:g9045.t1